MNLPQSTEIDELNRMLFAVAQLSVEDRGCSLNSVAKLCSSFVFGGRPANHRRTVRLCSYAGLLAEDNKRLALTELGKEFLSLNPDSLYELTDEQKQFVAERLILSGPWHSRARDLLLSFSPNYSKLTYEYAVDNQLPVRLNAPVHLLKVLGVLQEADGVLIVSSQYVAPVKDLLADRHGMTEDDLSKALQENRKLGAQAEEAVLEYERRRLRALGREAEASLVRRISQLDIGAGYDIESFDGDKPLFDYDRFIEVKASHSSELRFYWSANEHRVAGQRGSSYWIYFVGSFRSNKADQIVPIMIQDPANRLQQISQLRIEVSTYFVTQCDDLVVRSSDPQGLEGLLL